MSTLEDRLLVDCLSALSNINRLLILRQLRTPKALREIAVPDEGTGAVLARQTVRRHLDQLIEFGIVAERPAERDYGGTTEFTLNNLRIFGISEELRGLARLRPSIELDSVTSPASAHQGARQPGPLLVLVRGLDEGTTFPLLKHPASGPWVIGRRRGLAVSLDFDPSVSGEHAALSARGDQFFLQDLGSRNGTFHNLRPLIGDQTQRVRHGDIIGVGRSLLLFWE